MSLPLTSQALATYYVIAAAEASSNLSRYDGIHFGTPKLILAAYSSVSVGTGTSERDGTDLYLDTRSSVFGEEVQRRVLVGSFVLSSARYAEYLGKAHQVRRLVCDEYSSVFSDYDALLVPGALGDAPALADLADEPPVQHYAMDVINVPSNLAGM